MKTFRLILAVVILWGLSASCDNEIEIYSEDAPDMLFVLGCLDGTGSLQQVKIRKLISGNEDASLMINDPAYYLPDKPLSVFLEESSGKSHQLQPQVYPPQTGGLFSQDSNVVYELKGYRPSPFRTCTLRIEDPDGGKTISATAQALLPVSFAYPTQESALQVRYTFTDPQRPFQVVFGEAPASLLTVSLKYADIMLNGDTICRKANHTYPPDFIPHPASGRAFPLNDVWLLFNRSIQDDPDVNFRMFYRFDFLVWTGDSAIANYFFVAERFADNRRQSFNNIDGGVGLFFATSHARLINVRPHEKFLSFLAVNDSTRHLKFSAAPYVGVYTDPDSTLVNPFLSLVR